MELDIQIRKSVGDIAIIAQLASAEPMSFASPPAPNSIIEVPIVPRIKNKQTAVRNIRLTSAFFPFTLASETIIEIAVGSPAVDTRDNVVNRL